ncbi:hypothetical protein D9611_000649 [Ephemerocybe angulata]|uniref:Glycosyltransferase 61 catalytic domain-containing protein n=1 Tax=Ephemerocybe angulata TaxID=980116 RepID=A0A8H5F6P6_9AGAR|nr:hypothetical protein D9611_000649 [Tulosesus angulatus]
MFRFALTRRDAFLVLLGASSMHLWSLVLQGLNPSAAEEFSVVPFGRTSSSSALLDTVARTSTTTTTVKVATTATSTVTEKATETQVVESLEGWSYAQIDKLAELQSLSTRSDDVLPQTGLIAHAPGWTLFRNLYMTNDTLYIVTDKHFSTPSRSRPEYSRERRPEFYGPKGEDLTYGYTKADGWPEIRMMTSTGLSAVNSPENIASREPIPQNMQFIGVKEARRRWGEVVLTDEHGKKRTESRVWIVQGNSLLVNEPSQFLRHYYHLVAELFLGVQAFWHSAFTPAILKSESALPVHFSTNHTADAPPVHRTIFIHSNADGWRDGPGFNRYFLRAAFPSLTVEHEEDWQDRVAASMEGVKDGSSGERVWRFPVALLTDRSAAHRGGICGSETQRIAAEAWDHMRKEGKLRGIHVGGWWAPVREAIWKFAGVEVQAGGVIDGAQVAFKVGTNARVGNEDDAHLAHAHAVAAEEKGVVDVGEETQAALPMPSEIVITYISRQSARNRKLTVDDHKLLVESMDDLVKRKNEERKVALAKSPKDTIPPWEFRVLEAEHLSKDQQVQAAARTTILLGVHGNGLTHLVWMKPTRVSSVIEIFCPPGFAHDYWWTARSLGIRHWAMWNDTARTWPDKPNVDYPECFQQNAIPVHGPAVAKLVEDRIDGKL